MPTETVNFLSDLFQILFKVRHRSQGSKTIASIGTKWGTFGRVATVYTWSCNPEKFEATLEGAVNQALSAIAKVELAKVNKSF